MPLMPLLIMRFRIHTQRARCLYLLNRVQISDVAGTLEPATSELSIIPFPILAFNNITSKSESSHPRSGIISLVKTTANQLYNKVVNQNVLNKNINSLIPNINSFIRCLATNREMNQPFMNSKSYQNKLLFQGLNSVDETNTHLTNINAIKNNQENGERKSKQIQVNQNILFGINCTIQGLNKNLYVKISKNALAA